jgi:hypothetical protein
MTIQRVLIAACLAAALSGMACDDASSTPTSPSATSPVTETFSGQLSVGGTASRSFTSATSGTATLTLTQIGPPADVTVGFGIGIPQADGAGCHLTQSLQTGASPTPQFTVTVEAGSYCVRLFDTGALTSQVAFSVTIVRP